MEMTTVVICGVEHTVPVSWKRWVDFLADRASCGNYRRMLTQGDWIHANELLLAYRREAGLE